MLVKDAMRRYPKTLRIDDSLALARSIMVWSDIGHLPVVDGDKLVGILSETDITAYPATDKMPLRSATVSDAMTHGPQTAGPDDSLTEAAARMATDQLGCLPVTERGTLIGILTTTDVLTAEVRAALESPRHDDPVLGDVMTRHPVTCHSDDRLLDAAAMMRQRRVRHLPVVDGDNVVIGMLSDRDVRGAIGDPHFVSGRVDGPVEVELLRVADAMNRPAITTTADLSCAEAARFFVDRGASAIPVTDSDGKLLGIVSYIDLLRTVEGSAGNGGARSLAASQTATVGECMSGSPHSLQLDDTLATAHQLMREHLVHHLPVLDGDRLVGVVTMDDFHLVETLKGIEPEEVPVEDAMSTVLVTCDPDDRVDDVAEVLAERRVSCAVAVRGAHIAGMFTTNDALRALVRCQRLH